MSLVTRCPACATAFKVVRDQLRLSEGWVRCGRCGEVFDAQSDLREQLPDGSWVVLAGPASVDAPRGMSMDGEGAPAQTLQDSESDSAGEHPPAAVSPPPERAPSGSAAWPSGDWLDLSASGATSSAPPAERIEPRMPSPDLLDLGSPEDAEQPVPQEGRPSSAAYVTASPPDRPAADAAQVGRVLRRGRAWANAEPTALAAFLRPGRIAASAARQNSVEPSLDGEIPTFDSSSAAEDVQVDAPAPGGPTQEALVRESTTSSLPPPSPDEAGRSSSALPQPDAPALGSEPTEGLALAPLRPSFMDAPDENAEGAAPRRRRLWLWSLAALGLLMILGVQVLRQERDQWAVSRPALLPLLSAVCRATDCAIEAPRRIDDIRVDGSTLMRDGAEGHYRLVFTVRNAAAIAVAMPAIELSLLDGSERPVLRRVVQPGEMARAATLPGRTEEEVALALQLHAAAGRPLPSVVGHSVLAFYP